MSRIAQEHFEENVHGPDFWGQSHCGLLWSIPENKTKPQIIALTYDFQR